MKLYKNLHIHYPFINDLYSPNEYYHTRAFKLSSKNGRRFFFSPLHIRAHSRRCSSFFAKSHVRLVCSDPNTFTAAHCRFLLRCPALVAADKPPCQSSTAVPTNPRCILHRGRSDVLQAFCEFESSTLTDECRKSLFHVALTKEEPLYLYDIVVFYCFMLICRAAFMAALCYCFV